jgi:hypothetical protein
MIKISNCPITNLERFVTKKDLLFYESSEKVILECYISHYKDGVLINNNRIRSYKKPLVATTDTPVNRTTGIKIETKITDVDGVVTDIKKQVWNDPNTISEYHFFELLRHIPVVQETIQHQIILARDAEGKFNS